MILHQISNSYGNYNCNVSVYVDTVWEPHFHGNYELIYSIAGTAEIAVNNRLEHLHPEELLLIPPYSIHSLKIPKTAKTWVGVFSKDFITEFAQKYSFADFTKFTCDEEVNAFLKNYLFNTALPEHYTHIACLNLVCAQCLKHAKHTDAVVNPSFMKKTIRYITENLSRDITMQRIADELNYEYHYFSDLFHRNFSVNFRSFLNVLRFEEACRLLPDKSRTITEISNTCGFGSIRNFNRIFKELSGISPGEYRAHTGK